MGKSTLLTNLAGVYSEVAAYEFTTLTTVPGVIRYKGAKIQVNLINANYSILPHPNTHFSCWTCRVLLKVPRMERDVVVR